MFCDKRVQSSDSTKSTDNTYSTDSTDSADGTDSTDSTKSTDNTDSTDTKPIRYQLDGHVINLCYSQILSVALVYHTDRWILRV